ncbi:hypothetical protein AV530_015559 [Patagioenas fasciata monilis]|uniref:Uncharacterized protein n=1 Tax=Patagioenas fasciata monilis TaxID=372326 RepID=A0A1V4KHU8_PATFA|nr:hypothetical protein AV530_015559 [Patagioenas fasciata monilis]
MSRFRGVLDTYRDMPVTYWRKELQEEMWNIVVIGLEHMKKYRGEMLSNKTHLVFLNNDVKQSEAKPNRCAGMSSAHHCFPLQQNMTDNTTTQGNSWVETHNIFLVEKEADEAMEYLIGKFI